MTINIKFITEGQNIKVINAEPYIGAVSVPYLKEVNGIVDKRQENPFAFIKTGPDKYFISPSVVSRYNLKGGESVNAAIAFDFNKKKEEWNWTCVSINK